ncbi:MAG: NAD(P)/FAD-dependent oxidoreductase, partial [Nitrososphaerales archaeon]
LCTKMVEIYDVAIVGGGGAGLSAALFTSRLGLSTIVITREIGGRALINSPYSDRSIENYPGFLSITGLELMGRFEQQARSYGAAFVFAEVLKIWEDESSIFHIGTTLGEIKSSTVILAFGEAPKRLGVSDEEKYEGRGISYCVYCDLEECKGKVAAVVGFGERALLSTSLLSKVAEKVYLIYWWGAMGEPLDVTKLLEDKQNVELITLSSVAEVKGSDKLESVIIQGPFGEDRREIKIDYLFIELGFEAKTEFLKGFVELDENGKVKTDRNCHTSRAGVFAAGDVTDSTYKQIVISAGDGARAALSAYNYLQHKRGGNLLYTDIFTLRGKKTREK